ncbi:MAG: EthD family reductase [Anaerolineales bacterium]|nr:EthD family reductase [Anaerolineales bacterium]
MHKLIILFNQPVEWHSFEKGWHKFLALAEKMPGLRKEAVSEIERLVFGSEGQHYHKIQELYFESREALDAALKSRQGQEAGQWLHQFTNGRIVLFTAEHKEAKPEEFSRKTRS